MESKIAILIGIISFTSARPPADTQVVVANENELQNLVKSLAGQGTFDIAYSHHEDGPKTHHEDRARITPQNYYQNLHNHHHYNDDTRQHQYTERGSPTYSLLKKLSTSKEKPKYEDITFSSESDNVAAQAGIVQLDNIVDLLDGLEKETNSHRGRTGDRDDDRSYDNRYDYESDRCRCSSGRTTNDRDDYESERCGCSRGRSSYDRDDDCKCTGIRTTSDRGDNGSERCSCSSGRSTSDRGDHGSVRCACGRSSSTYDRDYERCGCSRGRSDSYRDNNDNDNASNVVEDRITNDRYEGGTYYDQLQTLKLGDNLDAVVINLADSEKLHQNHNSNIKKSQTQYAAETDSLSEDDAKQLEEAILEHNKARNNLSNDLEELLSDLQGELSETKKYTNKNTRAQTSPKILPHDEDNNNVYVPKWLLNDLVSNTATRDLPAPEKTTSPTKSLKSAFPLTVNQKLKLLSNKKRIFRRSVDNDIGVPFHIEVQGLSQVHI